MRFNILNKLINHYAKLLFIQKVVKYYVDGRTLKLVTCMALREACERHHDNRGIKMTNVRTFIEENLNKLPKELLIGHVHVDKSDEDKDRKVAFVNPEELEKRLEDVPNLVKEFNRIFKEKNLDLTASNEFNNKNGKRGIMIEFMKRMKGRSVTTPMKETRSMEPVEKKDEDFELKNDVDL